MELDSSTQILILFFLLLASITFSASETALTSINRIKLRQLIEDDVKGALLVEKLLEHKNQLLTTILIGNNIANIAASSFATSIALTYSDTYPSIVPIVTSALTLIVLIFGEVIPKTLANVHSERVSLFFSPVINICIYIFKPVAVVINFISTIILRIFGLSLDSTNEAMTEEDLKTIVNVSHEVGVLENDERTMINNVFEFGDLVASQIMTPRTEMYTLPITSTYEEVIRTFEEHKVSRIPVYNEDIDDIVGIVYLKDIMFIPEDSFDINDYIREVPFTYEAKKIEKLFSVMKLNRSYMAIVLDEYGGTAGIITLQDIVEEVFGYIHDEDDTEEELEIKKLSENVFLIDGVAKLDDINDVVGTNLDSENFDSLGGYIIGLFEDFPAEKASIVDEEHNIRFIVQKIDKKRVDIVKMIILENSEDV